MSKFIAGLFSGQKEASRAVEALAEADFDDTRVFEDIEADAEPGEVKPALNPRAGSGLSGVVQPLPPLKDPVLSLGLEPEGAQFLREAVRKGGVVVLVNTAEDRTAGARQILEKQGGRVFEGE